MIDHGFKYENLKYSALNNELYGDLDVGNNDIYDVVIKINGFPKRFPLVFEVGERIPNKDNRHKYSNNQCCLTTKAKEEILLKQKIKTLEQFIDKIVIPYFKHNSFYEINGFYKEGEYSHGIIGIIETYFDILHTNNLKITLEWLNKRMKKQKLNIKEPCFCESGKTLKKCHLKYYYDLSQISDKTIATDLSIIIVMMKAEAEKHLE
jgi:hypothetical protein